MYFLIFLIEKQSQEQFETPDQNRGPYTHRVACLARSYFISLSLSRNPLDFIRQPKKDGK